VVGRIEQIGPPEKGEDLSPWRAGDRVGIAWLGWADGHCAQCHAGRENLCEKARFTGWDDSGGYATHLVVKARFALRIPDAFADDRQAAPLLCGGVIGYRSLKRSGIRPGGRLGLYGFGASASLAIQVARHWGCRVFVCTRSSVEQQRARELGAEWAGSYDAVPPEPLDAAVTFAPSGDVVRAALFALDRGATVAINAIHLDRIPELPYERLWWERSLASVANFTRADAQEFLDLAARIPIRTAIDEQPLERANDALARLKKGATDGTIVLIPPT
jgi:propanol-preferring alcohol dehydrogenase